MQNLFRLLAAASAAAVIALPSGVALAQGAPSGGTAPVPRPAVTSAPAPEPAAPENTAAESASPEKKAAPKKKKTARMTRQQEIDRSVERGTVPARYRHSVPKEYHQYIPFDKQ
jgi:hypothetical protein